MSSTSPEPNNPEGGMPHERAMRIAARRTFVEIKQLFMRAVEDLDGRKGLWLRAQVRQAQDPSDLWLLRVPVLTALRKNDGATRKLRAELYKSLDTVFPDTFGAPSLSVLPVPAEPWALWAGGDNAQPVV